MGRDKLLRSLLRERFVVTLDGDQTFDGLLLRVDESTVELGDVYLIGNQSRIKADGVVYLPRSRVVYLQRVHA